MKLLENQVLPRRRSVLPRRSTLHRPSQRTLDKDTLSACIIRRRRRDYACARREGEFPAETTGRDWCGALLAVGIDT